MRIDRLRQGNPGDTKMIGNAVREMRVNHGPGYRVFYCQVDSAIYLLLCGGDKSTQKRDIKKAFEMAALLKAVDD